MLSTKLLLKLFASTIAGLGLSLLVLTTLGNITAIYAAGITVTTPDDEENNDGDCSLREAVKAASFNMAVDACTPGSSDADTIQFNLTTPATITLTLGEIIIRNEPLTINGPGANLLAISGNGSSKIFKVSSAVPVTITGLTINNGYATTNGGGLQSSGSLVLVDMMFLNNRSQAKGGAIDVSGSLVLSNSALINNRANGEGGAVYTYNGGVAVNIDGSQLKNNQSGFWGGALYTDGLLNINNTQFISNSAVNWGGAVFSWRFTTLANTAFDYNRSQDSYGAALLFDSGLITNSSFTNNTAAQKIGALGISQNAWLTGLDFLNNRAQAGRAGALEVGGSVWLTATRFIDNQAATLGGGLYHAGANASIVNSLFARNRAQTTGGAVVLASTSRATLLQNTVVAPTLPVTAGLYITTTGTVSIVNTIFDGYPHGLEVAAGTVFEDYNLLRQSAFAGPLTGGGHSFTAAPAYINPANNDYHHAAGSWAINTGIATAVTTDFDGDPRPGGGNTDIGFDETGDVTDIAIAKAVTVNPAPGAPITFTLTFSNAGGSMLSGIIITDSLPAPVGQVAVISSGVPLTDTGALAGFVWQSAPLSPGQQGIITLTGVLTQRLARGPFTNTAQVGIDFPPPPELTLANNNSSVMVVVPNFAPVAAGDVFTTGEDITTELLPVANDIDGEPLTLAAVGQPGNGTISFSGTNRLVYTPTLNFNGTDVFTYAVGDDLLTTTGVITVVVTPINDAPTITATMAVTMSEDGYPNPFDLTLHAGDVDADPLSWAITGLPAHGAATIPPGPASNATVAYTPTANYNGPDAFTVQVSDNILTATVTISVTITPVNDAPVAVDDPIMVLNKKNSTDVLLLSGSPVVTVAVLANDTDVENSPLTITAVGQPNQGGVAAIDPGGGEWLLYAPADAFVGTELFTYTITDGELLDTATVSATVLSGVNGGHNHATLVEQNDSPYGALTITIEIPAEVVGSDHFSLVYDQPVSVSGVPPAGFLPAGAPFALVAYRNGILLANADTFLQPLTVTIDYPNSDTANSGAAAGSLTMFEDVAGSGWLDDGVELVMWDQANQRQVLTVNHSGDFGVFRRAPLYLPLVLKKFADAPDLVVESLTATENNVQVVIANHGTQPVVDGFWVDVYLNPNPPPSAVNQTWPQLGQQGLAWGITPEALPLAPGQALTLTVGGEYYRPNKSAVTWPLAENLPIYAQVDSVNQQTGYGGVLETHEINGGAYNNIRGAVVKAGAAIINVTPQNRPSTGFNLPPR